MKLLLRVATITAIATFAAFVFGCSILDPGDRQELRNKISALPADSIALLKRMAMNAKALEWLRDRPKGDQMGKLQCRYENETDGKWSDWADQEPVLTVVRMLECLRIQGIAVTYTMCAQQWESVARLDKQHEFLNGQMPGVTALRVQVRMGFSL